MENTEGAIRETVERAAVVDYGQTSFQVRDLMSRIAQGKPIDWDRYGQVSPQARSFLAHPPEIPNSESYIILSHLVAAPNPGRQDSVLESVAQVITPEQNMPTERRNLYRYLLADFAIENYDDQEYVLYRFFSNPINQQRYPEHFKDQIRRMERFPDNSSNIVFFINPDNQVGREKMMEDIFENAGRNLLRGRFGYGDANVLILYFSNPQNRHGREELFNKTLEVVVQEELAPGLAGGFLLDFIKVPENQVGREDLVERVVEKISTESNYFRKKYFLEFFQYTENRVGRENQFQKVFEECRDLVLGGDEETAAALVTYFANPQNQAGYEELVDKAIRLVAKDKYKYSSLLDFFGDPDNVPEVNLPGGLQEKINTTLKRISDENLRRDYIDVFGAYLADPNNPLSLLILEKADDLPMLTAGFILGIDPLVVKSWNLTDQQQETLSPILGRLASEYPGLFKSLSLPFKPRVDMKEVQDFNEQLVRWFRTLDLLNRVPEELGGKVLLSSHIDNLRGLQEKYHVQPNTLQFSTGFMIGVGTELRKTEQEALDRFLGIVGLKDKGITFQEFQNFTESWNQEIGSILTLALHYQSIYPEGLPLLGNIIESLIKDTYESKRYDLTNSLTREQLKPIIRSRTNIERQRLLHLWCDKLPSFSTILETKKEQKEIDRAFLQEELRNRLTAEGHFHFDQLFELDELKNLSENQRKLVIKVLGNYLSGEKEAVNFGQFRQDLPSNLSGEHIAQLITLSQFFKTMFVDRKSPAEIHSSLDRLISNIRDKWPELYNLELVSLDLDQFIRDQLDEVIGQGQEVESQRHTYLTFYTDHPKTLLEIGKYPDSSSCQNFESTGNLNEALLGYVFDSHIKALCVVELSSRLDLSDEVLNSAEVAIDEGKSRVKIELPSGEIYEVNFSRPKARKMIMAGYAYGTQPTLVVEPLYSRDIDRQLAEELMSERIQKLRDTITWRGYVKFMVKEKEDEDVIIAGSHNPAGHYNDITHSASGKERKSYHLKSE